MKYSKDDRDIELSNAKYIFRETKDFSKYINSSMYIISEYFIANSSFVFGSILYKGVDNKIMNSPYFYINPEAKSMFEPILMDAFYYMNRSAAVSISKKLLENKEFSNIKNVLIHSGNIRTAKLNINYFDIKKGVNKNFYLLPFESIAASVSTDKSSCFSNMLEVNENLDGFKSKVTIAFYLKMASIYKKPLFFYLIKPKIVHKEYNGVLTLTLEKELTIDEYYDILYYFESIMSEVTIDVIAKQSRLLEVTKTIYGLGHLIKNRAVPAQSNLENIQEYIKYLESGIYAKYIKLHIENAKINLQRLKNIGHLLDIISRSLNARNKSEQKGVVFTTKKDWYEDDKVFDLSKELDSPMYKELNQNGIRVNYVNMVNHAILIEPIIELQSGRNLVRPPDFIYQELLLEVALNATTHGINNDGRVQVNLYHDHGPESWYYFENETNAGSVQKHGNKIFLEEWLEIELISTGGIYYYDNMLRISNSGLLSAMFVQKNDKYYFRLGFQLLGLNY